MLVRFALLWALFAPTSAHARPPAEPALARVDAPALVVDVAGLEAEPLREELRLRLPDRPLLRPRAPRPDAPIAYAIVRRQDGQIVLTLIMPGGHAYDRTLADEPGQSERVAASGLAALLDSIAAGRVEPSRTRVQLPAPESADSGPADEPSPGVEASGSIREPRVEVGPFLGPALGLGLAPRSGASAVLGGGAWLGLDLRLRRDVLITMDLRVLGRAASSLRLWRLRLAPGAGYRVRAGAFELPLTVHLVVEPWWSSLDGRPAMLLRDGHAARTPPLLGAMVRASPGVYSSTSAPGLGGVRVAIRVEAGGGFVPDQGARTVEIGIEQDQQREPLLRLGGLELGVGLELGLWFGR